MNATSSNTDHDVPCGYLQKMLIPLFYMHRHAKALVSLVLFALAMDDLFPVWKKSLMLILFRII